MARLLSIDPGKHYVGWALFEGSTLHKCGMDHPLLCPSENISQMVLEVPQIYAGGGKGDPNDLVDIAVAGGVVVGRCTRENTDQDIVYCRPRDWKGQRPKAVDNRYTLGILEESEVAIFDACGVTAGLKHNVIDAIGIGLWKLGRR